MADKNLQDVLQVQTLTVHADGTRVTEYQALSYHDYIANLPWMHELPSNAIITITTSVSGR